MLIILEGPDGCGKSTVARSLEATIRSREPDAKIEIWHRGAPKTHALNEYAVPLFSYRPGREQHIICDRWHLGEYVYAHARRGGETTMTTNVRRWIDMFLASRGAYVVQLDMMDRSEYAEVYRRRGDADAEVQLAELERVQTLYWQMAYDSFIYTPGPDPTDSLVTGFNDELLTVLHQAQRRARQAHRLNDLVTYVGDPTPNVLLVGDVRNPNIDVCQEPDRPAFVPYPPTSGAYLMRALDIFAETYPRHRVGIVNANDVDDVRMAWERVGQPAAVVALGTHAHKTLQRVGIGHGMVPHPQYARRFHHERVGRYAAAVIAAAFRNERITSWPH